MRGFREIFICLITLLALNASAASLPSTPAGSYYNETTQMSNSNGWYANSAESSPMLETQYTYATFSEPPFVWNAVAPGYWSHTTDSWVIGDTINFTDTGDSYEMIASDEQYLLFANALAGDTYGIGSTDYFLGGSTVPLGQESYFILLLLSMYGIYRIKKQNKKALK